MQIVLAKNSGFCFGVRRAVDIALSVARECGVVYTFGELIHNRGVIDSLAEQGVHRVNSLDELPAGATLIIRSHGVPPCVYEKCAHRGIALVDCTCPFVKRIHSIVEDAYSAGMQVVIAGDCAHPEVIGINGYCGSTALFVNMSNIDEISRTPNRLCLVAQTTYDVGMFKSIQRKLTELRPDTVVHNTICKTTQERQQEAMELSRRCDIMLVIGDRNSSNTAKLKDICEKGCQNVKSISNIAEIPLEIMKSDGIIVGVVAGASSPDSLIREVITRMSEMDQAKVDCCEAEHTENVTVEVTDAAAEPVVEAVAEEHAAEEAEPTFEEAFEKTMVRIHTGQVLTGSVVQIVEGEVFVNIGYKADGLIPRDEFSGDPEVDPATVVKVGDKIEVEVLKVNDGEGNVLLSRKSVESKKVWDEFSAGAESEGKIVEGIGKEVVKGGLIAMVNGVRAFIPASQLSLKYVENIGDFVGKTLKLKILEVDKQRKRIVASHKAVLLAEQEAAKREKWEQLVVGSKVTGVVRRLADFGAFVDIGGIDGLVHVTDAAWGRVKHPNEVFKVGQEIEVIILNVDIAKQRVSLGYKQLQPKPWTMAAEKYPIGSVVEGKVVRIVPFGAFVALEPTIDGLIHISQVGVRRVTKVEDEINVGDRVRCKVLEVNPEQKRISLSRKEVILEENPEIAEQIRQERAERERAAAERAEKRAADEQARQQQAQQREERRRERSEQSRGERPERPDRRHREDADYELPPVQSSTTSLAELFGDLASVSEDSTEE